MSPPGDIGPSSSVANNLWLMRARFLLNLRGILNWIDTASWRPDNSPSFGVRSMKRNRLTAVRLCVALCAGLAFDLRQAQAQELAVDAPPTPLSVTGAPFSAVATQQITREFTDGNRMARTVRVTRYYRDSGGRTRIERELSQQSAGPKAELQNVVVEIHDPITGERYRLFPYAKTVEVLKGGTESSLAHPPFTPPGITAYFAGLTIGPNEHGWSEPEALGEQVMEGVRVVGTRRQYILAAGAIGNEKPIGITIEQWFSPDLGIIVSKTGHTTTGGGSSYRLEHIVQSEPDPGLFAVPSDYTRRQVPVASK
jgi:hypothetical protein